MTRTAAPLACGQCGAPLAVVPAAKGMLAAVWGHAEEPGDGHPPGVPPVMVTYRRDHAYWDSECPDVPGFPVHGLLSLDEARTCAWTLLRRITPPRPVAEHVTGDGEELASYAAGWNIKGGTSPAGPPAGT